MGLDFVELVMGWEEALGVTITDADATLIRTPRMVIDLLAEKLGATDMRGGACLCMRAFYRLRRGFVSAIGVPRSQVQPNSKLRDLLPRANRKDYWVAVRQTAGLPKLPKMGWGTGLFFSPTTVAELTRWVVSMSPKALKGANESWTRAEIRTVVRTVTAEICGVTHFSDDDDFIKDLGLD